MGGQPWLGAYSRFVNAIPDQDPWAQGSTSADVPPSSQQGGEAGPISAGVAPAVSGGGAPDPSVDGSSRPPLAKWLTIYTLLRFGTLIVLTLLLSLLMPLILALLFAVVLSLPLSWVLFGSVRRRVNEAMAVKASARRGERERLRAALDGRELQ